VVRVTGSLQKNRRQQNPQKTEDLFTTAVQSDHAGFLQGKL